MALSKLLSIFYLSLERKQKYIKSKCYFYDFIKIDAHFGSKI